ncbi:MAG: DMT family transporter [Alphaproteobacteria bacterium]|nr:DMT family transporter [Alphaproteobacteria bacterium]
MKSLTDNHQDRPVYGILCAVFAFFLLSAMGAGVKILAQTHHVIEIAFYRNLIALVPVLIYIALTRKTHLLKTGKPFILFLRVMVGAVGLILTFAALKSLPLADATTLFFTSSLLSPALAFFILKERIGLHRWSAIIIGLCGILLVARPTGDGVSMLGVSLALAAASTHAMIYLFLRSLKSESSVTVTLYFFAGGVLLPGLFMPFVASMPGPQEWGLFALVGVSGGLAQYFMTRAFRLADVGSIIPVTYTGLLWATGFDILIWHDAPGWPVLAGGVIIISANLYILHRERKKQRMGG